MGIDAQFDDAALELLLNFSWPGNIRQLRNVIRFSLAVCDNGHIETVHLPQELYDENERDLFERKLPLAATPLPNENCDVVVSEAGTLSAALRKNHWNITAVSQELGICRATVYRQMKRFNIVSPTHQ